MYISWNLPMGNDDPSERDKKNFTLLFRLQCVIILAIKIILIIR